MDEESASNGSIFRNFEGEEMMGKVILFAIVSLFTAILFLLLLHLYARLFWWRVEHHLNLNLTQPDTPGSTVIGRNNQRRRFVFAQGQEDPPRHAALDSTTLRSIPILVFKSCDFKDGLECAVCLSHLVDGDKARVLPGCNHGFHVDCIDMWFQSHSTCPLCRNTVDQSSVLGFPTEPQNFPTNVLVWGDHNQVRSTGLVVTEDLGSSDHQHESTSSTNSCNRAQEVREVVVDIPVSSSEISSAEIIQEEEEPKSPMFTRLRSLKKLLSREKKGVVCINGSSGTNNSNL
ncbi:hypothetical protein IGI04_018860 [Brassica rapa subsp. trilocularis]|uniref:RING-type domain-containing protein n=1 Tax=Brassica rapa subsp. trilocularis TaxID=1813537 RepID=A0ABQ7MGL3_BRACM|nr:hypothetical protein IGI04_018860 [Brassica rapa subsp. trilocularis]